MPWRLLGVTSIFGIVLFVSKSLLGIERFGLTRVYFYKGIQGFLSISKGLPGFKRVY